MRECETGVNGGWPPKAKNHRFRTGLPVRPQSLSDIRFHRPAQFPIRAPFLAFFACFAGDTVVAVRFAQADVDVRAPEELASRFPSFSHSRSLALRLSRPPSESATISNMLLETVEAEDFRNLNGQIECAPDLNIIFGENGIGKTNWLEAIYLLATAKSFRTNRLSEAIGFDKNRAIVHGEVRQSENIVHSLRVILEGNTKTLTVNEKRETSARFMAELHTILFNSDQLEIVRGAPASRRTFLDDGIVSIFPPFVQTVSDYKKVIRQKNSLLHSARENEWAIDKLTVLLEPWNEQLVGLAAVIHKARVRYVERLNEALERGLFGKEVVSIRYASSLEEKGDLSDYKGLLSERLAMRVAAEMYNGRALIGPHRDELEISFDGKDLRKFGSSGQQRSALLVLLLAKVSVYFEQHNEYPLFLLDDIDAELDYRRIGRLLEFLEGKTQTFMTTSKESFVERFGEGRKVIKIGD